MKKCIGLVSRGCLKESSFCHKLIVLVPITLQPDGANLSYLKFRLFDLIEFIVWNIKGLRHCVTKI